MTHYETLGVPPTASAAEIKTAFRKLASHPDREGGDAAKSAAVNVAYSVLSEPARRARYDAGERDVQPPTPEEQRALKVQILLHAAMNDALDAPETETLGLISTVRKAIRGAAKNAKDAASKATADAARLERMKAKVKRKAQAGHDIVAELIDGRIAGIHTFGEKAMSEHHELVDALNSLDDYEEDAPAPGAAYPGTGNPDLQREIARMFGDMSGFGGRNFKRF